jgi:hypothetical protein
VAGSGVFLGRRVESAIRRRVTAVDLGALFGDVDEQAPLDRWTSASKWRPSVPSAFRPRRSPSTNDHRFLSFRPLYRADRHSISAVRLCVVPSPIMQLDPRPALGTVIPLRTTLKYPHRLGRRGSTSCPLPRFRSLAVFGRRPGVRGQSSISMIKLARSSSRS